MKVYIASKYRNHQLNSSVFAALSEEGFLVFLPEHIDRRALNQSSAVDVFQRCRKELESSDVLLAVSPYGVDVGSEITMAYLLRESGKKLRIVQFNTTEETSARHDFIRCMLDYESDSLESIVRYLKGDARA